MIRFIFLVCFPWSSEALVIPSRTLFDSSEGNDEPLCKFKKNKKCQSCCKSIFEKKSKIK